MVINPSDAGPATARLGSSALFGGVSRPESRKGPVPGPPDSRPRRRIPPQASAVRSCLQYIDLVAMSADSRHNIERGGAGELDVSAPSSGACPAAVNET